MEIITEKTMTDKTLRDDPQTILKPSVEEAVGGLGPVVVTTPDVEKTEVSVVKMVQEEAGEVNEAARNEKEGVFGNSGGEDEGMKVNCSENGISMVMDVEGSLGGENGSDINAVLEEKAGDLADERGGNASADPMDICSSEQNEMNVVNGANFSQVFEIFGNLASNEEMNENDEENVENGEGKGDEYHRERTESEDHDGSALQEEMNKNDEENVENGEDKGDEECNRERAESEDHGFVVGDFVWGKVKSHTWWPGQIYDPSDASDHAATLKSEGQLLVAYFGDRSFSWSSPSQLRPFIDNFEEMSRQSDAKKFVNAVQKVLEEVGRRVEAELMCKCQTANVTKNAGVVNNGIKKGARAPKGNTIKVLVDQIDPVELVSTLKCYATMEPGTRLDELELTVLKSCLRAFYTKKDGILLVDYHDPKCIEGLEEGMRSGGPLESPRNGDDKLYQKRKQKSVAELMGEDESKVKKAKMTKDGGLKEIKRKALVVSVTPENNHESGDGGFEEETMSPRQRKKSRYLSPPYLSPIGIGSGKLSLLGPGTGSGSFKEPKPEPEKVPEMAAKQLEDSLKKSSGKKAREKRRAREGSDPQEHKKTDAAVSVGKLLDGLLRAALDPSYFVQKDKNLPTITELVSSFRSSIYKEGSGSQSGKEKDEEDTSELAFIKQKLEWMSEMVKVCGESEMNADVKASLEGGLQEVLGKVVKMRGK
ncbi:putative non-specific serine/threonine protein kinase [Helianthus annuus]|nr:putative non-specific serine/threonine protein kinase [Helianthus annuus]